MAWEKLVSFDLYRLIYILSFERRENNVIRSLSSSQHIQTLSRYLYLFSVFFISLLVVLNREGFRASHVRSCCFISPTYFSQDYSSKVHSISAFSFLWASKFTFWFSLLPTPPLLPSGVAVVQVLIYFQIWRLVVYFSFIFFHFYEDAMHMRSSCLTLIFMNSIIRNIWSVILSLAMKMVKWLYFV